MFQERIKNVLVIEKTQMEGNTHLFRARTEGGLHVEPLSTVWKDGHAVFMRIKSKRPSKLRKQCKQKRGGTAQAHQTAGNSPALPGPLQQPPDGVSCHQSPRMLESIQHTAPVI